MTPEIKPPPALPEGFEAVRFIGSGQFAEVWEARRAGRAYAAKVVYPDSTAQGRERASTAELLPILRQRPHPHLIELYGLHEVEGRLVVVMELADESLQDHLRLRPNGLPAHELLAYMNEAAAALDFLQAKGVRHRDVKPANILLKDGAVKLADYGVSRLVELASTQQALTVAGTPYYMAPEVQEGRISARSDQYSLAVSYHELRTGRRDLRDPRSPSSEPPEPGLPPAESAALAKALQADPRRRYGSCDEMVKALARAVAADEAKASWRREGPAPSWRPFAALWAGGALVGTAVLVAVLLTLPRRPASPAPPAPVAEATPQPPADDAPAPPQGGGRVAVGPPPRIGDGAAGLLVAIASGADKAAAAWETAGALFQRVAEQAEATRTAKALVGGLAAPWGVARRVSGWAASPEVRAAAGQAAVAWGEADERRAEADALRERKRAAEAAEARAAADRRERAKAECRNLGVWLCTPGGGTETQGRYVDDLIFGKAPPQKGDSPLVRRIIGPVRPFGQWDADDNGHFDNLVAGEGGGVVLFYGERPGFTETKAVELIRKATQNGKEVFVLCESGSVWERAAQAQGVPSGNDPAELHRFFAAVVKRSQDKVR